ncbi:Cullin repeat-like-containing domain protein [Schizophyllum commune]
MQSSLRTRKSQAPPRKAQRSGTKVGKPAVPRDRKSRVDDKIKKRMSMRYAEISGPTPVGGIPAVPSLPAGMGAPRAFREQDELVREPKDKAAQEKQAKEDDKKILDDDNFDADAYLKSKLANSTEAEIKSLQSSLRRAQGDMAVELQRNVFNNYAEFVQISKEISTLENEMLELKESLSEYKSMPSLLHIPDPSTNGSTMSTFRRSSVADLRIMYFNQMQALHAQIEGSAKFAPTTPGRHVVNEMDGVAALNAATYKVVGKVKFVILDDLVLVARRRRRTAGAETRGGSISEGKLVAERCWPINEMMVLDTKDSPTMTNVFKIRHGKETNVYRTDTPADKKALLSQFRQVAEELADKRRKEREGEHERRKSMWTGADRSSMAFNPDRLPPMNDWMADLARNAGVNVGSSANDKSERDGRWVGEWADELTVAIALREWEKAVALVEQGKAKSSMMPSLATKLPILSSQLTSALLQSLSMPSNRKSTVIALISWLLRLEAGPAARSTFLNMRTQVLRSLVRKIPFEGHVGAYVGDLAVVTFTAIKHTADWFLASFKDNEAASAFIEWARKQIEGYAEAFRKQVYSPDVERKVVDECMTITYSQSRKLLQEYGLDFRFLFDDLLLEHPRESSGTKPIPAHFAFHARHAKGSEASLTPSSTPNTRSPATSAITLPDDCRRASSNAGGLVEHIIARADVVA